MADQVQIDFSNNTARKFMERLIHMVSDCRIYRDDWDANQAGANAFPMDGTDVFDNKDGSAPRTDAPVLQQADLESLRNIANNIANQLSPAAEQVLIGKMVRSYDVVMKS